MKTAFKEIVRLIMCLLVMSIGIASAQEQHEFNWQPGPTDISLSNQAVLKLPAGYTFLEAEQAKALLRRVGNFPSDTVLGLIAPQQEGNDWFIVVSYYDTGFIKDDDAKNWNADELLRAIKEGTAADNQQRKSMGIPELIISGWAQKPNYDASTNKVVWAVATKSDNSGASVNFNTLTLGRHGYISMNMVTGLDELAQYKSNVQILLGQLDFIEGKRYADFNSSTDKVAAVGLAALITGTAAKLGIFGKLWSMIVPLVLALKKVIIYLVIAGVALMRSFFKRSRSSRIDTSAQS